MLGGFVLPVDRFRALQDLLSQFDSQHPLKISALGPKTENAEQFSKAIARVNDEISWLSANNLCSVAQIEMSLPVQPGQKLDADIASLIQVRTAFGEVPTFWEAPTALAERAIDLIAEFNSKPPRPAFGFKLRTGGVSADAFPSSAEIANVLVAAARRQVPIKFTAGLHHPIRQFRDEVNTKMHGFLNVLGAAVLATEHKWGQEQTAAMLEDEDPKSFSFELEWFGWRQWKIDTERLRKQRPLVVSFGSCSFDEPREDLRALGLL